MRLARFPLLGAALLAATAPGLAVDRWEAVSLVAPVGDDDSTTINEPAHGSVQVGHDFDSASDQDWIKVFTRARRSYEARVSSGGVPWNSPACPPNACASFDLVNPGGGVIMPGGADGVPSASLTVGWGTGEFDETFFLRAASNTGLTGLTYDLSFRETTMFLPRFNNSGTQITVMIVRNTRAHGIAGHIHFFDAAGAHLHTQTLTMLAHSTLAFVTSGVPALQNASGSAQIAHTAGYGGLVGKAVAVEPSTGFTFDTALSPLPY